MGNSFDSYNTTDLKNYLSNSTLTPETTSARTPNEAQYDEAAAFSMIAYKNQDPLQRSDLDTAKLNFENNYQKFLMLFGQYSNAPLKHYPLEYGGNIPPGLLSYPITNKTPVFDRYPLKRPFTS